jgi:hypothetical protein
MLMRFLDPNSMRVSAAFQTDDADRANAVVGDATQVMAQAQLRILQLSGSGAAL